MCTLLLAALLAAAPAKIAPIGKIEVPKPPPPDVTMDLPAAPEAKGLSSSDQKEDVELRRAPGDLSAAARPVAGPAAKVQSVVHAKDFSSGPGGYRPLGQFETIQLTEFPSMAPSFKTCLRLTSEGGMPVIVRTAIKTPLNEEVASSRADVSFTNRKTVDLVIDWEGFPATRAGDYRMVVTIDGSPAGEFPLKVQPR